MKLSSLAAWQRSEPFLYFLTLMGAPDQFRKWLDWLVALSLAVASAGVVIWQNARLAVLWDLSYILENSYRISLGDVPYRDFPFPYAPLTFLTQAALIKLSGRQFFHHVIYCAVVAALGTLLTWRVLSNMLSEIPHARALALVLTLPLTILGVYAVFPHPFYDPDCTVAILACLLLLQHWGLTPTSKMLGLVTGAALVIPMFVKQNTGLAFLSSVVSLLVLRLVTDIWRRRPVRKYVPFFVGLTVTLALAVLLIHRTAGLENYVRWTVKFAAERRTPAFGDMIGVYRDPLLKWWLALFLIGAFLLWRSRGRRMLIELSVILMSAPFVWSVVYLFLDTDSSERAERLIGLWPFLLIICLFSVLFTIRRRTGVDVVLPLIVIATVHGAFLSQQLWGSTYALWPLFMILVATVVSAIFSLSPDVSKLSLWLFACLLVISLLISGGSYLRSHERLDYANLSDGDLTHSQLPELKGLSMRGSWIPDFEELVHYADKEIPRDDGILLLPGEDLFYYATGRRPRFPVLLFDHTVNPFTPQQIVELALERNIQWLIVKNELQMEEEPLEHKDELMRLLLQDFESVESLDNYEIYKRKSASEDNTDSEDDEVDSKDNSAKEFRN